MNNSVINYISQYISLTDEEVSIINEQNLFKHIKKNGILLSEGEFASECFFIIQGCVRSYYLIDGEERNTEFFFENQTIRPISYQTNQPSRNYLSCLEDCFLAIGSEDRNKILIEKIPKLASFISQMNEQMVIKKQLILIILKIIAQKSVTYFF